MALLFWRWSIRISIAWLIIGVLFPNVIKGCCYNTDCTYTYTDEEDACFMTLMYSNAQTEGFCYDGWCPFRSGSCQKKKSLGENCRNAGGNADNNYCVTNFCKAATSLCTERGDTGCIPTPKPTAPPTTPKPTSQPTTEPTLNPTRKPSANPIRTPTKTPTPAPTLTPSKNPSSEPSIATTDELTNEPTKTGSNGNKKVKKQWTMNPLLFFVLICVFLFVMALIIDSIIKRYKNRGAKTSYAELSMSLLETSPAANLHDEKQSELSDEIAIQNAMVILLAIGDYDDNPTEPDDELAQGLGNLEGVDQDMYSLQKLFGPNHLNYTIYSQYDLNDKLKVNWTQDEIVSLLKEKALFLQNNLESFDALIVAISSRELQGHICTSDCKMVEKIAIHRLFSHAYPSVRDIPRIFMFDCCDGELQRNPDGAAPQDQGKKRAPLEVESKTNEATQKNPDHKLVEINATTPGFPPTSKKNKKPLMLKEFVERTIANLTNQQHDYIYQTFEDIQQHLAQKQRILVKYHEGTRYVKLIPNQRGLQNNDMIS